MTLHRRSRLVLAGLLAAGAVLFGAAVDGMSSMDARLAASVHPRTDTLMVADDRGSRTQRLRYECPDPAPPAARPEV